jgi:hypothetical protein
MGLSQSTTLILREGQSHFTLLAAVAAVPIRPAARHQTSCQAELIVRALPWQPMAAKLNCHTRPNLLAYPAFRHIASMYNGGDQPREKIPLCEVSYADPESGARHATEIGVRRRIQTFVRLLPILVGRGRNQDFSAKSLGCGIAVVILPKLQRLLPGYHTQPGDRPCNGSRHKPQPLDRHTVTLAQLQQSS